MSRVPVSRGIRSDREAQQQQVPSPIPAAGLDRPRLMGVDFAP